MCLVLFAALAVAVQMGWTQALDVRLMLALGPHRPTWSTHDHARRERPGLGQRSRFRSALLISLRLAMIRRRSEAAGYASAALSGWALYGLLKFLFHRARPHVIPRLMRGAGWYSFPSGHATLAPLVFGLGRAHLVRALAARDPAARCVAAAALLSVLVIVLEGVPRHALAVGRGRRAAARDRLGGAVGLVVGAGGQPEPRSAARPAAPSAATPASEHQRPPPVPHLPRADASPRPGGRCPRSAPPPSAPSATAWSTRSAASR